MVAEYLIDRAAFGDHPLGRPVLGSEENLRSFTREGIVAFRERRWAGAHGGAFLVGNLDHLPAEEELQRALRPLPRAAATHSRTRPRPDFAPQTPGRAARHQPVAPAHDLPAGRRGRRTCASARRCRSTRRCWAARWARACSRRSARSAACATRCTRSTTCSPTCPILQLGSGLESAKCIEAYTRMREIVDELRDDGPDRGGGAAGARLRGRTPVLAFENTGAVARYARQPADRVRRGHRPGRGDRGAGRGHLRGGPRGRRGRRRQPRGRLRRPARGRGVLEDRPCGAGIQAQGRWLALELRPIRSAFSFCARSSSPTISRIQRMASSDVERARLDHRFDVHPVARPVEHRLEDRQPVQSRTGIVRPSEGAPGGRCAATSSWKAAR